MKDKIIIETEKNKRYCLINIITLLIIMILPYFLFFLQLFYGIELFEKILYLFLDNKILILLFFVICIFFVPYYAFYLNTFGLILNKCYKKIMIIWSILIILPLLLLSGWLLF